MHKKLNSDGSNLSIIVQGAIDTSMIKAIVDAYFITFPKCEIIISTWKNSRLPIIEGVNIIMNDDPGSIDLSKYGGRKHDNFNRQIVSSLSGIKLASRDFCLKVRSDILLEKKNFVDLYNNFNFHHELEKIKNCGFFLVNNISSKDPYFIYPAPLHFCDWFILSTTEEMKKLFNVNLIRENDLYFSKEEKIPKIYSKLSIPKIKWSVETYIWKEYLSKYIDFQMTNTFDNNKEVLDVHDIFLKSHCIISDNETIGITMKKKMYTKIKNYRLYSEYSYKDWLYYSEKYKHSKMRKSQLYAEIIFIKFIKYLYFVIYKSLNPFYVNKIKLFIKKNIE